MTLKKSKPNRILGLDVSSKSIAYCITENGDPVEWGEIDLNGDQIQRLVDLRKKMTALYNKWDGFDVVALEKPVFVQSKSSASVLSQSAGVVVSIVAERSRFEYVAPTSWYATIGNKGLTKAQKDEFAKANPGRPKSFYAKHAREARKQMTLDWVKDTFGVSLESDNVADAFGVNYHVRSK